MKIPRLFILCALILVMVSGYLVSASAYGDDHDAEVKRLEQLFTDILQRQAEKTRSGNAEMVTEGDVMVEKAGAYYAVTLPHISLKYPTGEEFELGIIAVNAIPGKNGTIKMTAAIPTPMIFYGADGAAKTKTTIGAQSLSGVWHEEMGSFTKLKAEYKNVVIKSSADQSKVVMPSIKVTADLEQARNGNWSGPVSINVQDIQVTSGEGMENAASLKSLALKMTVQDYSLDAAQRYEENLQALSESYDAGEGETASPAHMKAVYNLVTDVMMNAWDGFSTSVIANGFVVNTPAKAGEPAERIAIDQARLIYDVSGFRKNSVSMRMAMSYNGLQMTPAPDDMSEAAPTDMNFDISLDNLPMKELVALGKSSLEAGSANPGMGKMVAMQAMMSVPQLITQAGTKLMINDSYAGNKDYNVLVKGAVMPNAKAAFGATGTSTVKVRGIDKLLDIYKQKLENPDMDTVEKEKIKKTVKALSVMKLVGQQGKDKDGNAVRIYDFTLDESGQTQLNGTNIQDIVDQTK